MRGFSARCDARGMARWPEAAARISGWLTGCALVLVAGCSGTPLEYVPEPGNNLSGTWELVPELSDEVPAGGRLRARGGMIAFVTQDFPVLRARSMRIEQNRERWLAEWTETVLR